MCVVAVVAPVAAASAAAAAAAASAVAVAAVAAAVHRDICDNNQVAIDYRRDPVMPRSPHLSYLVIIQSLYKPFI